MTLPKKIIVELARVILLKIIKRYHRLHGSRMPIILVTGTAGKSSQTLMLKDLFEKAGWYVFSGASKDSKSYNSITGLIMTLVGFRVDFESSFAFFKKIWFGVRTLFFVLFESYAKMSKKTILVYEVGFDHQNESFEFARIFDNGFDTLITTSITYEHTGGFSDTLNSNILWKVTNLLPEKWTPVFENENIDTRLKNIALEQFHLLQYADSYCIPATIGALDNWIIDNLLGEEKSQFVQASRGKSFGLVANKKYYFSDQYILPHTFATTAVVLEKVAHKFKIPEQTVQEVVMNLQLPNGRFSLLSGILNSVIVDSTYNSDPQSVEAMLELLLEVIEVSTVIEDRRLLSTKYDTKSVEIPKHYLILGEMRELGETSAIAHQELLQKIIEIGKNRGSYIENVFLVGQEWLKCDDDGVAKIQDNVSFISFKNQLFKVFRRAGDLKSLLNADTIRPNSWFWVKGSQNTIFLEIIVQHLLNNKDDAKLLTRRGKSWDKIRSRWE